MSKRGLYIKQTAGMLGEPWRVMHINCIEKLKRIRHTCPFPLDPAEFIRSTLPVVLPTDKDGWYNINKSMTYGRLVNYELGSITNHYPFWLSVKDPVPCPSDPADPFVVFSNHRHWEAVEQWVRDAYELHNHMDTVADFLKEYLSRCGHPKWVGKYWPELLPFVGKVNKVSALYEGPDPRLLFPMGAEHMKEESEKMLAKCILLDTVECNAWVAHDID